MSGSTLLIPGLDGEVRAYYSAPASGTGPAVIVLQEWWGLVPHIESICDRFAEAGFHALAPDLYHGESTVEPDEAASLLQALNIADTEQILSKAIDALLAKSGVAPTDKVGAVGFCMGGQLAMFAAGSNPRVRATVNFYGIHPNVHPTYDTIQGSVLGHFAEHDDYAGPDAVAAMDLKLNEAGVPHEFFTYPATHHAFFNDTRPEVFNAEAAALAWERTVAFFREKLV